MLRQIWCQRESKRHKETVRERDREQRGSVRVEVTDTVHFSPFQTKPQRWVSEMSVGRRMSTTPCFSLCIRYTCSLAIDQPLLRLQLRGLPQNRKRFRPEMILWITGMEVEGRARDAAAEAQSMSYCTLNKSNVMYVSLSLSWLSPIYSLLL